MKVTLPNLPYGYKDLEPHISEEQLKIHHQKHHQGYVNGVNTILEKINDAEDMKSTLKALAFNIGGHVLHTLFWGNMSPNGGGEPAGALAEAIKSNFGSFENFKKQFTQTAVSVEGSGWAALAQCKTTNKLLIMQIEKHNVNVYPSFSVIMCVDVWEHAYYLDYKNERAKFIDAFWNLVNWEEVNKRFEGKTCCVEGVCPK